MKVTFENPENNHCDWIWHAGVVESNGNEFPFSLLEMKDKTSGTSAFELTWCEGTPDNAKEAETEVMNQFKTL